MSGIIEIDKYLSNKDNFIKSINNEKINSTFLFIKNIQEKIIQEKNDLNPSDNDWKEKVDSLNSQMNSINNIEENFYKKISSGNTFFDESKVIKIFKKYNKESIDLSAEIEQADKNKKARINAIESSKVMDKTADFINNLSSSNKNLAKSKKSFKEGETSAQDFLNILNKSYSLENNKIDLVISDLKNNKDKNIKKIIEEKDKILKNQKENNKLLDNNKFKDTSINSILSDINKQDEVSKSMVDYFESKSVLIKNSDVNSLIKTNTVEENNLKNELSLLSDKEKELKQLLLKDKDNIDLQNELTILKRDINDKKINHIKISNELEKNKVIKTENDMILETYSNIKTKRISEVDDTEKTNYLKQKIDIDSKNKISQIELKNLDYKEKFEVERFELEKKNAEESLKELNELKESLEKLISISSIQEENTKDLINSLDTSNMRDYTKESISEFQTIINDENTSLEYKDEALKSIEELLKNEQVQRKRSFDNLTNAFKIGNKETIAASIKNYTSNLSEESSTLIKNNISNINSDNTLTQEDKNSKIEEYLRGADEKMFEGQLDSISELKSMNKFLEEMAVNGKLTAAEKAQKESNITNSDEDKYNILKSELNEIDQVKPEEKDTEQLSWEGIGKSFTNKFFKTDAGQMIIDGGKGINNKVSSLSDSSVKMLSNGTQNVISGGQNLLRSNETDDIVNSGKNLLDSGRNRISSLLPNFSKLESSYLRNRGTKNNSNPYRQQELPPPTNTDDILNRENKNRTTPLISNDIELLENTKKSFKDNFNDVFKNVKDYFSSEFDEEDELDNLENKYEDLQTEIIENRDKNSYKNKTVKTAGIPSSSSNKDIFLDSNNDYSDNSNNSSDLDRNKRKRNTKNKTKNRKLRKGGRKNYLKSAKNVGSKGLNLAKNVGGKALNYGSKAVSIGGEALAAGGTAIGEMAAGAGGVVEAVAAGGMAEGGVAAAAALASNPIGWAIAGGLALGAASYGIYNLAIDDDSMEVTDKLEDLGAMDHNLIGDSEINDWAEVAKLSKKELDALARFDDFDDDTLNLINELKSFDDETRSVLADGLDSKHISVKKDGTFSADDDGIKMLVNMDQNSYEKLSKFLDPKVDNIVRSILPPDVADSKDSTNINNKSINNNSKNVSDIEKKPLDSKDQIIEMNNQETGTKNGQVKENEEDSGFLTTLGNAISYTPLGVASSVFDMGTSLFSNDTGVPKSSPVKEQDNKINSNNSNNVGTNSKPTIISSSNNITSDIQKSSKAEESLDILSRLI